MPSSIRDIISREAASLSDQEVEYFHKTAFSLGSLAAALATGGVVGGLSGHYLGSRMSNAEREALKEQASRNALLGAGAGAATALALRKPVQGFVAPDPEDAVVLDDEEFDDLWKQRKKYR